VDLGELTRLLMEKVEENVLYIFQLEERINKLEKMLEQVSNEKE